MSAGNGAAMRAAAVVGASFADRPGDRDAFGRGLAEVTHRDPRAIEGSLYVAELAAACSSSVAESDRFACQDRARRVVSDDQLGTAIDFYMTELGPIGDQDRRGGEGLRYLRVRRPLAGVRHAVLFLKHGDDPMSALAEAISAGGDTDSIAAILGGWLGALHGEGRGSRPA